MRLPRALRWFARFGRKGRESPAVVDLSGRSAYRRNVALVGQWCNPEGKILTHIGAGDLETLRGASENLLMRGAAPEQALGISARAFFQREYRIPKSQWGAIQRNAMERIGSGMQPIEAFDRAVGEYLKRKIPGAE